MKKKLGEKIKMRGTQMGNPEDAEDMVNQYGTYNIQPTADTENEFPAIAQGLGKKR